jgi:phasin
MNTNHKPKGTANVETPQHLREITEKGVQRSKEFFENAGATTAEAANALQSCWSKAFKGMQEYNDKLAEFAQANTKAQLEFMQKLGGLRSPTEFFELSTKHTQQQFERLTEQSKLLSALAQRVTLEAAEPIKTGLAKAHERAA